MKCADVMGSHQLQLTIECNFTYASNGFLITCIDYNLQIIVINGHFSSNG